jgi:hypothetical protein
MDLFVPGRDIRRGLSPIPLRVAFPFRGSGLPLPGHVFPGFLSLQTMGILCQVLSEKILPRKSKALPMWRRIHIMEYIEIS